MITGIGKRNQTVAVATTTTTTTAVAAFRPFDRNVVDLSTFLWDSRSEKSACAACATTICAMHPTKYNIADFQEKLAYAHMHIWTRLNAMLRECARRFDLLTQEARSLKLEIKIS